MSAFARSRTRSLKARRNTADATIVTRSVFRDRALRAAHLFWIAAALATALHAAHVILGLGGESLAWIVSLWSVFAVFALCTAAVTARAFAAHSRRNQLGWSALAVGLALYALATPASILFPA